MFWSSLYLREAGNKARISTLVVFSWRGPSISVHTRLCTQATHRASDCLVDAGSVTLLKSECHTVTCQRTTQSEQFEAFGCRFGLPGELHGSRACESNHHFIQRQETARLIHVFASIPKHVHHHPYFPQFLHPTRLVIFLKRQGSFDRTVPVSGKDT